MLDLSCCFDIEEDISKVIKAQRHPTVRKEKPDSEIHIRLVGQEKYNEILYVWNDISPVTRTGPEVTLVGLYEPAKQKNSILFIHELELDIINCTVNQDLTMIAYVIRIPSSGVGPKGDTAYLYRAYLAEIQPQHRIFDLNVERSALLRVQFLWPKRASDRDPSSTNRDSRLLFFLHKESIGLYQLSLARMGDKRVVMSGPPETSSVLKKFIWAQWDASSQRLFVVFIKSKQGDRVPPVMRCLEFKSSISNPYTKMMDLTLPFPIYGDSAPEGYVDVGLSKVITDKSLNMEVILQSGGSLCICYQHPVKRHNTQQESQNAERSSHGGDTVDLSYSVIAVHHMKVVYGSALQVSWDMAADTKLYFSPLAGYVLVYAPGLLLHMLNVSPDVEPCLHIAIPQADVPTTPITSDVSMGSQSQTLTHFSRERATSFSGDCIYNNTSGKAYKLSLSKERIPYFFNDDMSHSLKIAVIHLVLVHLRDPTLYKKMLEPIFANPTSLELKEMIAEILVGSTFSTIRRQIEREELLLLPFSNADPTRSQIVEAPDGERLASFKSSTYKLGALDSISKRDVRERRSSVDGSSNFWEILDTRVRSLVFMGKPLPRFSTISLRADLQQRQQAQSGGNRRRSLTEPVFPPAGKPKSPDVISPSSSNPSIFKKVAASARKVMSSRRKKQMKAREEDFRILEEKSQSPPDNVQEQLMELTMDALSTHMHSYMPSVSSDKLVNIASEYVTCQLQQSKQLIMSMMKTTGFPQNPKHRQIRKISLLTAPPEQGREMFQLVEQYFMAVQELSYPLPPGFFTLFTIAGFRCLDRHMFLQYLDHGVLITTEEFVSRLLEDVPDDSKENVEIKYHIITRLPRHTALQVIERWNHPISTKFLAQQYVADLLRDDSGRDYYTSNYSYPTKQENSDTEEDEDSIAASFPPLATLMKLLESKDPQVIIRSNQGAQEDQQQTSNIEPRFVEKVALQNTVSKYGKENLKEISF